MRRGERCFEGFGIVYERSGRVKLVFVRGCEEREDENIGNVVRF